MTSQRTNLVVSLGKIFSCVSFLILILAAPKAYANDGIDPAAVDDSTSIIQGTGTVLINWMSNDTVIDFATINGFDAMTLQGGSVTLGQTGFFNYTPDPNFTGNDGFTYTICDDDKPTPTCSSANVNITIIPKSTCDSGFYQGVSGQVKLLDVTSSPASYVDISDASWATNFNATGYNDEDGLIYGFLQPANGNGSGNGIYSFNPATGVFTFMTSSPPAYIGDFDGQGNLYMAGGGTTITVYNVATNSTSTLIATQSLGVADMGFVPSSPQGYFYGVRGGGTALTQLHPDGTVTVISLDTSGITNASFPTAPQGNFGAVWVSSDGNGGYNLYAFNNANGVVYAIDLMNNTITPTTLSEPNGRNDGMSCAAAIDPFDLDNLSEYGDAPDSYGTLQSSNGAAAVTNISYRLGNIADIDRDGNPSADATNENSEELADDDGVFWNGVSLQDQSLAVGVPANVQILVPANNGVVSAWFDWDQSGTFDAGEKVVSDQAPVGGLVTISTAVPANAVLGQTFARVRLSARPGGDQTGRYSFGEIEDYRISIENPTPELTSSKSVDISELSEPPRAGDTVTYFISVQNTGNVTIDGITVTDDLLGGDITEQCIFPIAGMPTLNPNEVALCEVEYEITQENIDAGSLENQAQITGVDPDGGDVSTDSDDDTTTEVEEPTSFPLSQEPSLELIKIALDFDEDNVISGAGEIITYYLTLTNTGNVSIDNLAITDPLFTGDPDTPIACDALTGLTLLPNENVICEITYEVTQTDMDNGGVITNQATGTGDDPNGEVVVDISDNGEEGDSDPTVVPGNLFTGMETVKQITGRDYSDPFPQEGDTIEYTITLTNTGNVTLNNVTLEDPLFDPSDITSSCTFDPDGLTGFLYIGKPIECVIEYTLTQDDLDNGGVENTATGSAIGPSQDGEPGEPVSDVSDSGDAQTDEDDDGDAGNDPTEEFFDQNPAIEIEKTGELDGAVSVDETITYTFTVANTGNVTINNITVTDDLLGGDITEQCVFPDDVGVLAPGEDATCTAQHTITQGNIDVGVIENSATTTGDDPSGESVDDASDDPNDGENEDPDNDGNPDDPTETLLPPSPELTLIKTVEDQNGDGEMQVGEELMYTFTITNTGNITVNDINLEDSFFTEEGEIVCNQEMPGVLSPTDDAIVCTASYTITQEDFDAGFIENTATASGVDPQDNKTSDVSDYDGEGAGDDPTVFPSVREGLLNVIKTADYSDIGSPAGEGDEIIYTIVAENIGNVTITDVVIIDPLFDSAEYPDGDITAVCIFENQEEILLPGELATCEVVYELTPDDLVASEVVNSASAVGIDPEGNDVVDTSDSGDELVDEDGDGSPTNDPTVVSWEDPQEPGRPRGGPRGGPDGDNSDPSNPVNPTDGPNSPNEFNDSPVIDTLGGIAITTVAGPVVSASIGATQSVLARTGQRSSTVSLLLMVSVIVGLGSMRFVYLHEGGNGNSKRLSRREARTWARKRSSKKKSKNKKFWKIW